MSGKLRPHLALIAVQILFGTWPLIGKVVLRSLTVTSLVACRLVGAALAFALLQRQLKPLLKMRRQDFALLVLCAVSGVVGNQLLYVKALSLTTVINAALLTATIPVVTLFVSILVGYDQWSWKRLLGIVLAAAGVVYLINPARAELTAQTTLGNLLLISNAILYAIYIVLSKRLFDRYGALNVITWIFVVSAVIVAPLGFYSFGQEKLGQIGWSVWLLVGVVILLPTVGAYYLNAWALTQVSPSTVAMYIYLQPLIAFGFAPWLLGERWSSRTGVATLLIFAGLGLVTSPGRSRAVREISEHPDALAH
ncbi:MAG TPA: DMT family transporter [Pyrinomonadaceae bacterium]|nr:DMT family transporter [Pyrinomonadaceae bacterium]